MPRPTAVDRCRRKLAGQLISPRLSFIPCVLLLVGVASCGGGAAARKPSDGGPDGTGGGAGMGAVGSGGSSPTDAASQDAQVPDGGSASPLLRRLAAGRNHTCLIRDDGTVWCWGGETSAAVQPIMSRGLPGKALAIASGGDEQTCAVTESHAVWCWTEGNPAVAIAGLDGVAQMAVGSGFACAVKMDGTVWCWGGNTAGQLGDGTTGTRAAPVAVIGIADAVEVGVGVAHACLRRSDGSVMCWGENSAWQLGDGTTIGRYGPVSPVDLPRGMVQLAVGPRHTCARTAAGVVWCWGLNGAGESGSSGAAFIDRPAIFPALGPAVEIRAGGYYDLGGYDQARTCVRKSEGTTWCAGRGANGELGDGTADQDATDAPVRVSAFGQALAEVAVGGAHGCAWAGGSSDAVWCWGRNYFGQLGRDTPYSPVPKRLEGFGPFTDLAVGDRSACGRTTGGYSCWGDNGNGQLGIGPKALAFAPVALIGLPVDVKQFAVGGLYSCWLRTTGQVLCSGGKYGDTPVALTALGTDNLQLAAGNGHACTIKRDGTLWCWGNTICGLTPTEFDPTPQTLFASTNAAVFLGTTLTCSQRVDGTVWCCGDPFGYAPIQAAVGNDAVELELGLTGCARKANGTVLCGPGFKTLTPVDVTDSVELAVSDNAACARKVDGSVWCWGTNDRGVLGTGVASAITPSLVTLPTSIVKIEGGAQHFCALDATGRAWCWGDNYLGQLGDGTGGDRPQPALTIWP